jgi:cell wall-associated NlpC family hydrolase
MSASLQDYFKAKGKPTTPDQVIAVARGVYRENQNRTYSKSGWSGDPSFRGGIDCSDFVSEYLRQIGIQGDWDTCALFAQTGNLKLMQDVGVYYSVDKVKEVAKPGDVIVWADHDGRDGHTGYVIADGQIAESTTARDQNGKTGVQVRDIDRFLRRGAGQPIRILRPPQMAGGEVASNWS